jgi:hypothetical protein
MTRSFKLLAVGTEDSKQRIFSLDPVGDLARLDKAVCRPGVDQELPLSSVDKRGYADGRGG